MTVYPEFYDDLTSKSGNYVVETLQIQSLHYCFRLNIGYEQLITIINQLPVDEVNKLRAEIEKFSIEKNVDAFDDLESIIANGPVMSDEKYKEFENNRKKFSQWRAS